MKTAKQINTPQTGEYSFAPDTTSPLHVHPGSPSCVREADGTIVADHCTPQYARLIAAAPDMFAALEYVFERLNDAVDGGVLDKSPFYPSWQKVSAALAKARGEKEP